MRMCCHLTYLLTQQCQRHKNVPFVSGDYLAHLSPSCSHHWNRTLSGLMQDITVINLFISMKCVLNHQDAPGGAINSTEIYLLKNKVKEIARSFATSTLPVVKFTFDTKENFWSKYHDLIVRKRNTKDEKGNLLYFPFNSKTYKFPESMDNIVKMWHTIQSSWNLMDSFANKNDIRYSQVAMIRSDVMYVTALDIYERDDGHFIPWESYNKTAFIPCFFRWPVNDRMI